MILNLIGRRINAKVYECLIEGKDDYNLLFHIPEQQRIVVEQYFSTNGINIERWGARRFMNFQVISIPIRTDLDRVDQILVRIWSTKPHRLFAFSVPVSEDIVPTHTYIYSIDRFMKVC